MNRFLTMAVILSASCSGMPSGGYNAAGPLVSGGFGIGYGATSVAESYHAGPPVAQTYVQHGVVGSRTVQVGSQPVQVGHQYVVTGQDVHQPQPYSYVAQEARSSQTTVPIAPPAIPHAGPPVAAIPPAPVNLGPAPADTVTQQKIFAPARTHTRITPQVTQVQPELRVNRYPVEFQVNVPVPVEREVIVQKQVTRPYRVDVPHPVAVPAPYKVHPVHNVVQTPVVRQHSFSVHTPAAAVPVAVAAGHAGYAH